MLNVYILYGIVFIASIITIVNAKNKYRTLWNHYLFYNFIWLFLIFLSLFFNNYQVPVQPKTYIIFLTSLLFFNFTILFVKKQPPIDDITPIKFDLRKRRILEIFVLICLIPQAFMNYQLIKSGIPLYLLNYEYWHEVRNTGSYLYLQFLQLFIYPLFMILISTVFYNNYSSINKYSHIITFLFAFCLCGCYFLISGGGRAEMMILLFVIILSFCAISIKIEAPYITHINKTVVIAGVICIMELIQFANEGRGKEGTLIDNSISGYIIFAPLFEHYLNTDFFGHNNTWGASMFEGIILWLQYPFKLIGCTFYDTTINEITQQFVYIPQLDQETNNQVSACFVYMRDFGWFGIAIGPIITAWIYHILYKFGRRNSFYFLLYFTYILRLCGTNINFQLGKNLIFVVVYSIIICHFWQIPPYGYSKSRR